MKISIEDYKEDKELFRNETHFESRITGEILERNGRKSINEQTDNNPQLVGFALVAEVFRLNDKRDENSVKYLYQEWNYPKDYIDMIFDEFGNSFDESNLFLNRVNACNGNLNQKTKQAWESYCDEYEVFSGPSTDKFSKYIL
jgi:hypothetical protein